MIINNINSICKFKCAIIKCVFINRIIFTPTSNINIFRDWGWAPEFSDAIYKINNKKIPEDYVVGTGKVTSLKYIIKKIFKLKKIDRKFLRSNTPKSLRPTDIKKIGANPKKIYNQKVTKFHQKLNHHYHLS